MRVSRSVLASLATILVLVASAVAGPRLIQDEIEQRVSGLEARVTVLEQQVATLQAGGVSAAATPVAETYTVTGRLDLWQDFDEPVIYLESANYCSGTRGYDDIQTGANVVILDGAGNTLATTQLETASDYESNGPADYVCEFEFTVEVPEADFYTLKIGRRGAPTYSFDEMVENDWEMSLTIGM